MFLIPWDPDNPVSTPSGLKNKDNAAKLLRKAAEKVLENYGSLDVPWGDVYRFRIDSLDFPANGGPGDQLGIFRTMNFAADMDKKQRVIHGDTFFAVVEFSDKPHAMVLLSYGNSSRPGSKHGEIS